MSKDIYPVIRFTMGPPVNLLDSAGDMGRRHASSVDSSRAIPPFVAVLSLNGVNSSLRSIARPVLRVKENKGEPGREHWTVGTIDTLKKERLMS